MNVLYQALSESSFVTLALAIGWQHGIKSNKDKKVFSEMLNMDRMYCHSIFSYLCFIW